MKARKGISQKTHMHNPQTQTAVWQWPEGREGEGRVEAGKGGGNEDICKSVNNKNEKERTKSSLTSNWKTLEMPAIWRLFWH